MQILFEVFLNADRECLINLFGQLGVCSLLIDSTMSVLLWPTTPGFIFVRTTIFYVVSSEHALFIRRAHVEGNASAS